MSNPRQNSVSTQDEIENAQLIVLTFALVGMVLGAMIGSLSNRLYASSYFDKCLADAKCKREGSYIALDTVSCSGPSREASSRKMAVYQGCRKLFDEIRPSSEELLRGTGAGTGALIGGIAGAGFGIFVAKKYLRLKAQERQKQQAAQSGARATR